MSRNRDDWLTRLKAVERDYSATRFATDRLADSARRDPTVLGRLLEVRVLLQASDRLELTYFIRLFAVFESGLRHFWRAHRPGRRPRTEHLLDAVTSARGIPSDLLVNARDVIGIISSTRRARKLNPFVSRRPADIYARSSVGFPRGGS
jgi:hypothetical protein